MFVIDAANVIGSRPDGWWRDRAAAARRLLASIDEALEDGRLGGPVVVVLEGAAARGITPSRTDQLRVVCAPGSGDDTIVAEAAEAVSSGRQAAVVTADRALRIRLQRLGAEVRSPGGFLRQVGPPASKG